MPKCERQARFLAAWKRVASRYEKGFCVSERGFEAQLVSSLELLFPEQFIVVEPTWKSSASHFIPDVVMVREETITDIFELKFVPHGYAVFEGDLEKLAGYVADPHAVFPVRIDPVTGKWHESRFRLDPERMLHFVVVSSGDSEAVYPESVIEQPALSSVRRSFCHWYGRTGHQCSVTKDWGIKFGI